MGDAMDFIFNHVRKNALFSYFIHLLFLSNYRNVQTYWKSRNKQHTCLLCWGFFFFDVDHFLSLYWIYYNIASALSFGSLTRDETCITFIGRQSLNHWTPKDVPYACIVCMHATVRITYINVIWFPNSVAYFNERYISWASININTSL